MDHSKDGIRLIYCIGVWICGLWGPFHLFTRTRLFFESYSVFDFSILGIGILVALIVVKNIKNNHEIISLLGWIGEISVAYWAIFTTPLGIDGRATATIQLFEVIPSAAGAIGLNLTIFFSTIVFGCTIQLELNLKTNWNQDVDNSIKGLYLKNNRVLLSTLIGLLLYLLLDVLLPESLITPFIIIGLIGSITLLFWGINYKQMKEFFNDGKEETILATPSLDFKITRIKQFFLFIIVWLSVTISMILGIISFTARLHLLSDTTEILSLLGNIAIGTIIILIFRIALKRKSEIWNNIFILQFGLLMALFEYNFFFNQNSVILFDPIIGIGVIFMTWAFLQIGTQMKTIKTTGIWLQLSWLISAYTAYIPLKQSELQTEKIWIIPTLLLICVLSFAVIMYIDKITQNKDRRDQN